MRLRFMIMAILAQLFFEFLTLRDFEIINNRSKIITISKLSHNPCFQGKLPPTLSACDPETDKSSTDTIETVTTKISNPYSEGE